MRLINAETLELNEFLDSRLPRYAILSHTWEDGEVTLEDMQKAHKPKQKRGYDKIRLASEQALKDRLFYIWVDTCCKCKGLNGAEPSVACTISFQTLIEICTQRQRYRQEKQCRASGSNQLDVSVLCECKHMLRLPGRLTWWMPPPGRRFLERWGRSG